MRNLEEATPVENCALVICLPLSLADVEAHLASGRRRDYVRAASRDTPAEESWAKIFASNARQATELMADAAALEVDVRSAGDLATLGGLFRTKKVVTLVAHFMAPDIRVDQIIDAPLAFERLKAGLSPEVVKYHLADVGTDGDSLPQQLAMAFVQMIKGEGLVDVRGVNTTEVQMRRRLELQSILGDSVELPAQVELSDGLHPVSAIAEQIPADFDGIVHLALCHSIALAEPVKAGHKERSVLTNLDPLSPRAVMFVLNHTYRLLANVDANGVRRSTMAKTNYMVAYHLLLRKFIEMANKDR